VVTSERCSCLPGRKWMWARAASCLGEGLLWVAVGHQSWRVQNLRLMRPGDAIGASTSCASGVAPDTEWGVGTMAE
jgi:hypothetical protein